LNICNDEPFIKLNTAANAYFGMELWAEDASEKHFEHLHKFLDLYVHIYGICDIYPSAALAFESDGVPKVAKNINGMCEVLINHPTYDAVTYRGTKPSVTLNVSPFIESIAADLVGGYLIPVDNYINYNNYWGFSFVQLSKFINHAKETGIEIDALFLEPIITADNSFCELKRLSNKNLNAEFNPKQAANKYLKYFGGVLEKTIIKACKYASDAYDRQEKVDALEQVDTSNIADILKIIKDTPPTTQNIEQLKSALPDDWRDALFANLSKVSISPTSDVIENNSLSSKEQDNLYKTIGLLTKAFVHGNGTNFGSVENPNANKIKEHLDQFLPKEPVGLRDRAIRERIKRGVYSLKDC
jgi:hypothetical protein